MAKNKIDSFLAEVFENPAVKEIYGQVRDLEREAEAKRAGFDRFRSEIAQKESKVEALQREAERVLSGGGDPMPILEQASSLKTQIASMSEMLPEHRGFDPGHEERSEIERLQNKLRPALVAAINESQAFADTRREFNDLLKRVQDLVETWGQMERQIKPFSGSILNVYPFIAEDKKLSRFCQNFLGDIR